MTGKTKTKKTDTKDLVTPYEPTPQERAAVEAYFVRNKEKPPGARMKVSEKDGVTQIAPDHPEAAVAHVLLMEAIGAKDLDFLDGLLRQLVNAGTQGRTADEHGLNFMLSVVKGTARESHCRHVNGGHLRREHRLHLVFRLHAFDHREHKVEPPPVHRSPVRSGIRKLPEQPVHKVRVRGPKCPH